MLQPANKSDRMCHLVAMTMRSSCSSNKELDIIDQLTLFRSTSQAATEEELARQSHSHKRKLEAFEAFTKIKRHLHI